MANKRFKQKLHKLENMLRILLALAPFVLWAGLAFNQWYFSYGQRYNRIDMPDSVVLTGSSHSDSGRGDGCPCYRTWSYTYRIKANKTAVQALADMRQAYRDTGYNAEIDEEDPPTLRFSIKPDRVYLEASSVNPKTEKYDASRIYVTLTEMY